MLPQTRYSESKTYPTRYADSTQIIDNSDKMLIDNSDEMLPLVLSGKLTHDHRLQNIYDKL